MKNRHAVIAFFLSLLLIAPQLRAGEVARWNRVMTDAAVAAQMDPLNESRVFAIVQAAVHDALNAIDRRYEPYRDGVTAAPGERCGRCLGYARRPWTSIRSSILSRTAASSYAAGPRAP